jgi:predicted RND superfamily exporter protein
VAHAWPDRLHRLAVERGALVLAAALALSMALGIAALRLPWTQDPEVITLEGSDALDAYRDYVRRWGSDKWIVLAYDAADAFHPARLAQLRELTDALFEIEGVRWVASLDSAFAIEDGPLGPHARPLVPEVIEDGAAVRRAALASPLIREALVSADGATLALAVELEAAELDTREVEEKALAGIDAVLARPAFADLRVHRAGAPVFNRELARLNARDQALFVPITVAVIAVFLVVLLRSAWLTAAALGVLLLCVVWTLGTMSWLGIPMNITTGLLPPLLLVVSVAESVHFLTAFADRLRA